jgi:hypothetical protein
LFIAYVAGLFDGEGCIWWDNTPRVAITSCYPKHLVEIRNRLGIGKIRRMRSRSGDRRTCFQWEASGDNALKFLVTIAPHMREKRYQTSIIGSIAIAPPRSYLRKVLIRMLAKAKRIDHA